MSDSYCLLIRAINMLMAFKWNWAWVYTLPHPGGREGGGGSPTPAGVDHHVEEPAQCA